MTGAYATFTRCAKTCAAYDALTRLDVSVIAFATYLAGVCLATAPDWPDVLIGIALAAISTNAIYSLNAWSDRRVDSVNKPHRPVPSGKIRPRAARRYALCLLFLSIVYPFFVARTDLVLGLFLLLPVLGAAYSLKPLWLKRFTIPSVIITSAGLVVPVQIGYFMKTHSLDFVPFFAALFLYCLSIIPLKDIDDVEGDRQFGFQNAYSRLGPKLLPACLAGLLLNTLLVSIVPMAPMLRGFLLVLIGTSALIMLRGSRPPPRTLP